MGICTYIASKHIKGDGRMQKLSGVIAIDDGGSSTCVVTKNGNEMFPSIKGRYGERHLTSATGKHDFIVEYQGEKYVMGTLALYDCAMPLQMHTNSKQHDFFDLSVLVAIHKYGYLSNNVIVSVPIAMHNEDEKNGRIARLKKSHTITVNGETKTFAINDVKVAPESAVAYWVDELEGKHRFLDLGSRTIGYATTINQYGNVRFIDSESGTIFGKGLEALDTNYNARALADFVCGKLLSKWGERDRVQLLGGGALDAELVAHIRSYFPNAVVMENPKVANAVGMYNLGRITYNSN